MAKLVEGELDGRRHRVDFHVGDLPGGVYFVVLEVGKIREVYKMIWVR